MDTGSAEEDCPVCKGTVQDPSAPTTCCNKVFCQSCLTQSVTLRNHCPYCRTPVPGNGAFRIQTSRLGQNRLFHPLPGVANIDASFSSTHRVGNNIQELLNQLRDAQAQVLQNTPRDGNVANQAAPASTGQVPHPTVSPLQMRPFPRLRTRASLNRVPAAAPTPVPAFNPFITAQSTPAPQVAPPPALSIQQVNSSSLIIPDSLSDTSDELLMAVELSLLGNAQTQPSGPALGTFKCPYCEQDGLDDLDLRDHCNDNHLNDLRSVVCPVCVSLPHGDPLYRSRDFIGHLNLRHCYYIRNITNVQQSDEVNLQAAILMSLSNNN